MKCSTCPNTDPVDFYNEDDDRCAFCQSKDHSTFKMPEDVIREFLDLGFHEIRSMGMVVDGEGKKVLEVAVASTDPEVLDVFQYHLNDDGAE